MKFHVLSTEEQRPPKICTEVVTVLYGKAYVGPLDTNLFTPKYLSIMPYMISYIRIYVLPKKDSCKPKR